MGWGAGRRPATTLPGIMIEEGRLASGLKIGVVGRSSLGKDTINRGSSVSKDIKARKSLKNFTEMKTEWRVCLEP